MDRAEQKFNDEERIYPSLECTCVLQLESTTYCSIGHSRAKSKLGRTSNMQRVDLQAKSMHVRKTVGVLQEMYGGSHTA